VILSSTDILGLMSRLKLSKRRILLLYKAVLRENGEEYLPSTFVGRTAFGFQAALVSYMESDGLVTKTSPGEYYYLYQEGIDWELLACHARRLAPDGMKDCWSADKCRRAFYGDHTSTTGTRYQATKMDLLLMKENWDRLAGM
jgi:hypothetical protein